MLSVCRTTANGHRYTRRFASRRRALEDAGAGRRRSDGETDECIAGLGSEVTEGRSSALVLGGCRLEMESTRGSSPDSPGEFYVQTFLWVASEAGVVGSGSSGSVVHDFDRRVGEAKGSAVFEDPGYIDQRGSLSV